MCTQFADAAGLRWRRKEVIDHSGNSKIISYTFPPVANFAIRLQSQRPFSVDCKIVAVDRIVSYRIGFTSAAGSYSNRTTISTIERIHRLTALDRGAKVVPAHGGRVRLSRFQSGLVRLGLVLK